MSTPVGAVPLPLDMTHPLETLPGIPDAFSAQLDALWHYGCVVSGATLHCYTTEAQDCHLNAAQSEAASTCSSYASQFGYHAAGPQVGSGSHAASSSSSHSESPAYQRHQNPHLRRVFNTFDEDGDGTVSIHEISRVFEKLGIEYSTDSLLASLVPKSTGYVDEQEFLFLYESVCRSDTSASSSDLHADVDQDLLAAFHVFDKDGNGFISPAELQSVLCSLGFPQGRQLEDCVDMIARVDENKDGHVDFSEFKKLFLIENPFIVITSH